MKKLTLLIAIVALGTYLYKHTMPQAASAEQPPSSSASSYISEGALKDEIINGDTTLLELPRLAGGNSNYFVTHRASGRVNYSFE